MVFSKVHGRSFWAGAVLALVIAALLVAYLQRRHEAEQELQTTLISEQMSERTAALLAGRLRREFEAALAETIEGIDHADLRELHLPIIADALRVGLDRHAYVERFFLWNERLPPSFSDQMLFYDPDLEPGKADVGVASKTGKPLGGLHVLPPLGHELLKLAHSPDFIGTALILVDRVIDGSPYQIVMHTYGADRWPEDVPGIIGYMVNLDDMRRSVIHRLISEELARLAPDGPEPLSFQVTVLDDRDQVVVGTRVPEGVTTGRSTIDMGFYPLHLVFSAVASDRGIDDKVRDDAGVRLPWWTLRVRHEPPRWALVVSVPTPSELTTQDYLYWAVLALILIALSCAAVLHRQSVRLSRLHTDFVANVTHQLKTPLSLLAAASETLQRERVRTPDKVREYAALVGNQTTRLANLVERILRLSRIDDADESYEFTHIDLVRVVREAVDRFGATMPTGSPTVTFRSELREAVVHGDAASLEDVMTNLLENASKYTNGPGQIRVTLTHVNDEATVSVKDDGVGITRGDLPHVFDKFYRGRSTVSTVHGFGVGLSIVQSIIRAHGGRVAVESELGAGSEFTIVLPLVKR